MEEKVQIHLPEVQEISDKSPKLILFHYKSRIQVKVVWGNDIKRTTNGGDYGGSKIRSSDDWHLLVPFFHSLRHLNPRLSVYLISALIVLL